MSNRCDSCLELVPINETQPCIDCLQLTSAMLKCSADGPTVGTSGTQDVSVLLDNETICTSSVVWSIEEYNAEGFASVSINPTTGVISYQVSPTASIQEYYEIVFRARCSNASQQYSASGSLWVCVVDKCFNVTCGPGTLCWPATGECVTADAVDIANGDTSSLETAAADATAVGTDCTAAGAATTYTLVEGSEVNATVVNLSGVFTATPVNCGAYSFQYETRCDGVLVDTATVSGYWLCATATGIADAEVTGDLAVADVACNKLTTTWAETSPAARVNLSAVTVNANGTYSVSPVDLSIPWSFTYDILCGGDIVDSGTVTGAVVTATAEDDAGTSAAAAVQVTGNAATNDTVCSQGTTAYQLKDTTGNPVNGTVDSFNTSTAAYEFTPAADGPWSFEYEITCTIGAVTQVIDEGTVSGTTLAAITTNADALGNREQNVTFEFDAAANDTDTGVTCDPITYRVVTGSETGCTVVNNLDGTFDITPTAGGAFNFTYEACCADGTTCDTAVVSGNCPLAVSDNAAGLQAGILTVVSVVGNDSPCTGATTTYVLTPLSEVNCVVVDNLDGTFDVTPSAVGAWSFLYDLKCDGITFSSASVYGVAVAP